MNQSTLPRIPLLIDGQFVASQTGQWRDVVNPATQDVLAHVPFATAAEVDAAVASARKPSRPGARRPSAPARASSSSTSS